jgi:hypothetical protein
LDHRVWPDYLVGLDLLGSLDRPVHRAIKASLEIKELLDR